MSKNTLWHKLMGLNGNKAEHTVFKGDYGEIEVFTLFYRYNRKVCEDKLLKQINKTPYNKDSKIPEEYLKKLACINLIELLKTNSQKSVYIDFLPEFDDLVLICRYAKTVYILKEEKENNFEDVYFECGTRPVLTNFFQNADITVTKQKPFILKSLPEPFCFICPKDFSPTLFAGLLYKENGYFIC